MSSSTNADVADGSPVYLFGDLNEEPNLTDVEKILCGADSDFDTKKTGNEVAPSTEGLTSDGMGNSQCENGKPPKWVLTRMPFVSRVIDKDGNARITVILDGPARKAPELQIVLGFIDSASENDIVDLTIVGVHGEEAPVLGSLSILSAMKRCKAKTIVRAGTITTIPDLALLLSADEMRMSPIGHVAIRTPHLGFVGEVADCEVEIDAFRKTFASVYCKTVIGRGFMTIDELSRLYKSRVMFSLYGENLKKRLASLRGKPR